MAKKGKRSILSTEPQARKVLEGIRGKSKKAKPKSNIKQGDKTAKSPKGLNKSKAQGMKEKAALRKKAADRRKKRSTAKKKPKKGMK